MAYDHLPLGETCKRITQAQNDQTEESRFVTHYKRLLNVFNNYNINESTYGEACAELLRDVLRKQFAQQLNTLLATTDETIKEKDNNLFDSIWQLDRKIQVVHKIQLLANYLDQYEDYLDNTLSKDEQMTKKQLDSKRQQLKQIKGELSNYFSVKNDQSDGSNQKMLNAHYIAYYYSTAYLKAHFELLQDLAFVMARGDVSLAKKENKKTKSLNELKGTEPEESTQLSSNGYIDNSCKIFHLLVDYRHEVINSRFNTFDKGVLEDKRNKTNQILNQFRNEAKDKDIRKKKEMELAFYNLEFNTLKQNIGDVKGLGLQFFRNGGVDKQDASLPYIDIITFMRDSNILDRIFVDYLEDYGNYKTALENDIKTFKDNKIMDPNGNISTNDASEWIKNKHPEWLNDKYENQQIENDDKLQNIIQSLANDRQVNEQNLQSNVISQKFQHQLKRYNQYQEFLTYLTNNAKRLEQQFNDFKQNVPDQILHDVNNMFQQPIRYQYVKDDAGKIKRDERDLAILEPEGLQLDTVNSMQKYDASSKLQYAYTKFNSNMSSLTSKTNPNESHKLKRLAHMFSIIMATIATVPLLGVGGYVAYKQMGFWLYEHSRGYKLRNNANQVFDNALGQNLNEAQYQGPGLIITSSTPSNLS